MEDEQKRYLASLWLNTPGPVDIHDSMNNHTELCREFDSPVAARLWCGKQLKNHPESTGSGRVEDLEKDEIVWQV